MEASEHPVRPPGAPGPFAKVAARRYHLYPPGIVYTIISLLIVLGAINGQNNLLFWAFGLAVAGLLISGILSGASLIGVQIRRHEPFTTEAGQSLLVRYTIRNKNRLFPCYALRVEELVSSSKTTGNRTTWQALMTRPTAFVAHLPPRGETMVDAEVTPWGRGQVRFDAIRVSTTFPFGLTLKSVLFTQPQEAIVRAWRPALAPGAIRRLLSLTGRGERSTPRRGPGDETYALREYRSGDTTRAVAWRPTARLGHLIVREPALQSPARVAIVVGPGASAESRERIVSLVASLASRATGEGVEVGVLWPEAGVSLPPRSAPGGSRALDSLALAQEAAPLLAMPLPITADDSAKVVIHDVESRALSAPGVAWISVDDPALAAHGAWETMPKAPDASGGGRARLSFLRALWEAFKRVLGGWA